MILKRRRHAHAHEAVSCWCKGRLGHKEPYHLTGKPSHFSNALTLEPVPLRLHAHIPSFRMRIEKEAMIGRNDHLMEAVLCELVDGKANMLERPLNGAQG